MNLQNVKVQERLEPRTEPYFQKVSKGVAIGLWVSEAGSRSWIARVRHNGNYRQKALDGLLPYGEALEEALGFAKAVRSGEIKTPSQERTERLTISQLIERYVDDDDQLTAKGKRHSEWRATALRLSKCYVFKTHGDVMLSDFDADQLRELQNLLRRRVSAETVNRGLVTLRAALNWAEQRGWSKSPTRRVKLLEEAPPTEKAIVRPYLPRGQREALIETAGPALSKLLRTLNYLGCRPSEARRLTVRDFRSGMNTYLNILTYKGQRSSGTVRRFPLAGERLEFFEGLLEGAPKDAPLLTTEKGLEWSMANAAKAFKSIRLSDDMDMYCWRHSVIQDWVDSGMATLKIAKLAGTSEKYILDNYTTSQDIDGESIPL